MQNKFSPSIVTSFFLILILFVLRYLTPGWTNILSWDVMGYYLYLPAKFIHHDLGLMDFSYMDKIVAQYHPSDSLYQIFPVEGGQWLIKYTMGFAILYAPFFFIGHVGAYLFHYVPDGFSAPYQYAILAGAFVYSILGILVLRKVLKHFFSEKVTCIVLIAITLGTNYMITVVFDGAMPHNALFTLYACLLYLTIKWHEQFKLKQAIGIGLVLGLITLYRPSEAVCIFIPIFWNIWNKESFKAKLELLKQKKIHVIALVVCMIMVGISQLLYWKSITGRFLVDSYGNNAGEGFEFFHPFPLEVLFSFKKGWLIYTPMMSLALIGFYFLYKRKRELFLSLFVFFAISFYIICSWSNWWYAGSFGQRSLIESYAVLAIPFGFFISYIVERAYLAKVGYILISFFILLNLFQAWQFSEGIIHNSRMTKKYYLATFGKTTITDEDRKLLEVERSTTGLESIKDTSAFKEKDLAFFDFEDCVVADGHCSSEFKHSGKLSLKMDSTYQFSKSFSIPYSELTDKEYAWVRASVYVYPTVDLKESPGSLILTFEHKGKNYKYHGCDIEKLEGIKLNEWNRISVDYMTPFIRTKQDKFVAYFWHRGKQPIFIDDLKIQLFDPKE